MTVGRPSRRWRASPGTSGSNSPAARWRRSGEARPSEVNGLLDAAALAEPQSPVAPAYRIWAADNLAREGRHALALRAFDVAIEAASAAPRFTVHVDPVRLFAAAQGPGGPTRR